MNPRRKNLLIVLPLLILLPWLIASTSGLGIGSIEVVLWFAMLAAWAYAFVVWGRRRSES